MSCPRASECYHIAQVLGSSNYILPCVDYLGKSFGWDILTFCWPNTFMWSTRQPCKLECSRRPIYPF